MIGEPRLLFGTMTLRGTRGCAVGACPLIMAMSLSLLSWPVP